MVFVKDDKMMVQAFRATVARAILTKVDSFASGLMLGGR